MTEQKKSFSETALASAPCLRSASRQEPKRTVSSIPGKLTSVLLIFAVTLVTLTPPKADGQTLGQALPKLGTSLIVPNLAGPPPAPESDLKKSLDAAVARLKADTLNPIDFKRLEKEHDAQQVGAPTQEKWTRKKKILVALTVVLLAGALVVAIKHRCRSTPEKPCPEPDFSIYNDY
jgi:hypothetical protein